MSRDEHEVRKSAIEDAMIDKAKERSLLSDAETQTYLREIESLREQLAKAQAERDEQAELAEEFRLKIPTTAEAMAYLGLLNKYKALQAQCASMRDALEYCGCHEHDVVYPVVGTPKHRECKFCEMVDKALSTDAGKELLETLERYRKALEFYADQGTWLKRDFYHGQFVDPEIYAMEDGGKKAQQALHPNDK